MTFVVSSETFIIILRTRKCPIPWLQLLVIQALYFMYVIAPLSIHRTMNDFCCQSQILEDLGHSAIPDITYAAQGHLGVYSSTMHPIEGMVAATVSWSSPPHFRFPL